MNDASGPPLRDGREDTPRADAGMPAIDHAGAISRLMGDRALFARVLERFRHDYRQAAARIGAALDGGDAALALRLAHTLKGAAGLIEAVPLRYAAHALEQVLRAGADDPRAHLARLERALEDVLRECDATPGTTMADMNEAGMRATASRPAPTLQRDGGDVLARLARLLEDGNGDAVDFVCDAAAALTAQLGERSFRELATSIDAFDFDGALALLERHAAVG